MSSSFSTDGRRAEKVGPDRVTEKRKRNRAEQREIRARAVYAFQGSGGERLEPVSRVKAPDFDCGGVNGVEDVSSAWGWADGGCDGAKQPGERAAQPDPAAAARTRRALLPLAKPRLLLPLPPSSLHTQPRLPRRRRRRHVFPHRRMAQSMCIYSTRGTSQYTT